ncbi:cytochrome P450 2C39-like isoform 2-T2 [Anomaloglossus baeobatrachus]
MELSTYLLLGLFLLILVWWRMSRHKGFPPGPVPLPVSGNILQIDFSNPLKAMRKFSEEYGSVYTIYLGFTPAVVVQGLKDLKEILVNKEHDYADRPHNRLIADISGTKGLVVAPYGQAWKEHRRFTLSTLRNFGLGKKSIEERICEESIHLITEFKMSKDTLLDPHHVIDNAVSNIICMIVFGRRYEYNDPTFRDILNLVHENMKAASGIWAQGMMIITDLTSIHYDERLWKYPHVFNPENFLNAEGELMKVEGFLPFSAVVPNPLWILKPGK